MNPTIEGTAQNVDSTSTPSDKVFQETAELEFGKIALRESEELLAGIPDGAHEAVISIDEAYRIILFNRGTERIFGYQEKEVLGKPLEILIPKRFAGAHRAHVDSFRSSHANAQRMNQQGEISGHRKNGTEFPAEASISKLEIGEEHLLAATLRGITGRKQAEEALRREEERQRQLPEDNLARAEIGQVIGSSLVNNQVDERFATELKKLAHLDRLSIHTLDHEAGTYKLTIGLEISLNEVIMPSPLGVLIVADRAADAEFILHELWKAGFDPHWQRVETESDFLANLQPSVDIIFAGNPSPDFEGVRALQLLEQQHLDIPLIMVTTAVEAEVIVKCVKQGASDYIFKDNLARLGEAVSHALDEKKLGEHEWQEECAPAKDPDELWRLNREMSSVDEVARIIINTLDNYHVYEQFSREMKKLVDFDRPSVGIIDNVAQSFIPTYKSGVENPDHSTHTYITLTDTLNGQVVETGSSVIREDINTGPRFAADSARLRFGLRSSITILCQECLQEHYPDMDSQLTAHLATIHQVLTVDQN